jgi:hypothetical protein
MNLNPYLPEDRIKTHVKIQEYTQEARLLVLKKVATQETYDRLTILENKKKLTAREFEEKLTKTYEVIAYHLEVYLVRLFGEIDAD